MEIVETGPFNTVQDLGRPGFRDIGVSAGGAMDPLAASIGNILVGNPAGSATVEVQTFPFKLRFTVPSVFAVTGADGVYLLNGKSSCPGLPGRPMEETFWNCATLRRWRVPTSPSQAAWTCRC